MSDEQRLIVDIVSRRDYKNLERQGKTESNDVYTKKAKGKSAWEALENLKYDDGSRVFKDTDIWKICYGNNKRPSKKNYKLPVPQLNGELDLTKAIKDAGFGDRLIKLAQQDQGLTQKAEKTPTQQEKKSALQEKENPFNGPTNAKDVNPFSNNTAQQLQYNDNKLNNLFVASYNMMEDDTELIVKTNGKELKGSKQEILTQLAQDGEISADEQKKFIEGAVKAAQSSYKTDGKNKRLKKGEKNTQEDIEMFNKMPVSDFSKLRQKNFSKKYLEDNTTNTRDKRNAKISARRVLTDLSNEELENIAKASGNASIITKAPEPIALTKEEIAQLKLGTSLPQMVLENNEVMSAYEQFKATKDNEKITVTAPDKNWVIELTSDKSYSYEDYKFYKFIPDKNNPDNYTIIHHNKEIKSQKTETGSVIVETKDFIGKTTTVEEFLDKKLIEQTIYSQTDNIETATPVSQKFYKHLSDGTKIEEVVNGNISTINKYDANNKLINSEILEFTDNDNKYALNINGKKINVSANLTEKTTTDIMSKVPSAVLNSIPIKENEELSLGINADTQSDIQANIKPTGNQNWNIDINKDNTYNILVFDKDNKNVIATYNFDKDGKLLKKEPQTAEDLNKVFPSEENPADKTKEVVKTQETQKPQETNTAEVKKPEPQTQTTDIVSQLKYNDNELNNLFVSSVKMLKDDEKVTISFKGKETTGTKNELLSMLAKDGKITKDAQEAFILGAVAATKATYAEDGKHRNLKNGKKNSAEDLAIFTNLPLKSFYNLKASFIKSVKDNKKDALITARRSLTELSNNELKNIVKKSGDASIIIELPKQQETAQKETEAKKVENAKQEVSQKTVVVEKPKEEPKATATEEKNNVTKPTTTPVVAKEETKTTKKDTSNPKLALVAQLPELVRKQLQKPEFGTFDIEEKDGAIIISKPDGTTITATNIGTNSEKIVTVNPDNSRVIVELEGNGARRLTSKIRAGETIAYDFQEEQLKQAPVLNAQYEPLEMSINTNEEIKIDDTPTMNTNAAISVDTPTPASLDFNAEPLNLGQETPATMQINTPTINEEPEPAKQTVQIETPANQETVEDKKETTETEQTNTTATQTPVAEQKEEPAQKAEEQNVENTNNAEPEKVTLNWTSEQKQAYINSLANKQFSNVIGQFNYDKLVITQEGEKISITSKDQYRPGTFVINPDKSIEHYDLGKLVYKYNTDGTYVKIFKNLHKKFDQNDKLIGEFKYDDNGKLTEEINYDSQNKSNYTVTTYAQDNSKIEKTFDSRRLVKLTTTNADGTKTEITAEQKQGELLNIIYSEDAEKAKAAILDAAANGWNLSFKGKRNEALFSDKNAKAVNEAWKDIEFGFNFSAAERLTEGLQKLAEIKQTGAPISPEKMTTEDLQNFYQDEINKTTKELTELIQTNQPITQNSECVKKLREFKDIGLEISFPLNETIKGASYRWNDIFKGNTQVFDRNIAELLKARDMGIPITPNLTQAQKDDFEVTKYSKYNPVLTMIERGDDVTKITNSEEFKNLIEFGRLSKDISFEVKPEDKVVAPLMHNNRVVYDINWLDKTYKKLAEAINDGNTTLAKSTIEELQRAKANGFPVDLSASKEYKITYAQGQKVNSEIMDKAKSMFSTSKSGFMQTSTAFDLFDTLLECYSENGREKALKIFVANLNTAQRISIFASGLAGSNAKSNEFANAIYLINSKEQIDEINQIIYELGKTGSCADPKNALASWVQWSGNPDLMRHLGQYDPYFQALYENSINKKPIKKTN